MDTILFFCILYFHLRCLVVLACFLSFLFLFAVDFLFSFACFCSFLFLFVVGFAVVLCIFYFNRHVVFINDMMINIHLSVGVFRVQFSRHIKTSQWRDHSSSTLTLFFLCISETFESLKSLHKTFWGTTEKCENENLS